MEDLFLSALVGEMDVIAHDSIEGPRELFASIARLAKRDARLVPGPVGIVLEAGQRAIDAGRADFEPIAALDRIAEVEHMAQPPRDLLAIVEVELTRVRALGHDLQSGVGASADHAHAHEIVPELLHLGFDHPRKAFDVGHSCSIAVQTALGPEPWGPSLRQLTMSRREPRYKLKPLSAQAGP